MSWQTYYKEHCLSVDALVDKLPKENVLFLTSHAAAEPKIINAAIAARKDEFHNCILQNLLVLGDAPYCAPEMEGHLRYRTIFGGAGTRPAIAEKRADYVPLYYYQYPEYVRRKVHPDVAILHVTKPDENGWCSFGVTVDFQMESAREAKLVVAQVNEDMPFTEGNCHIHVTDIDWFAEVKQPLPQLPQTPLGEVEKAIGANCASLVRNGDCLQLGIGAIPDAVLVQLKDKHDLGIHSEMFSDGVVEMTEAGIINNRCKQLNPGKSTATFLMGTDRLYQFAHKNPGVFMAPVDYTNDPRVVCRQDNMVTINGALQIDIYGQVAADTIGRRQYSGPGGQVDFVRGANMSAGGRNIIALPSTAKKGAASRISLLLPEGGAVTTNRFDVDYVVTEYGVAQLWGKNLSERAEALIAIAHPAFREELKRQVQAL